MLQGIVTDEIDTVWAICSGLLQKVIDRDQKDFLVDDIHELLKSRDMQLWVWRARNKITACLVTKIVNYPRRRVCQMPYIAGADMKDWLACEPIITAWAKENGCSQLEGFARKGWLRVLPHWRVVWTTIRKDI